MKYTVVIRQPVPESVLPQLQDELQKSFGLSADQAAKLATRRSGRLMKPNSRPRAERLAALFGSVGAQVMVEEVRDDTALLADPFVSQRPGPVLPERGSPGEGLPGGEPPEPAFGGLPPRSPAPSALSLPAGSVAVVSVAPAPPLAASTPSRSPWEALDSLTPDVRTSNTQIPEAQVSETHIPETRLPGPATAPALDHRGADSAGPDTDLAVRPLVPTGLPDLSPWSGGQPAHPVTSPNGDPVTQTVVLAAPLPPNLSGAALDSPVPSGPDLTVAPLQTVPVQASADDAWADFTGSLSSAAQTATVQTAQPGAPADPGVLRLETPAEERPAALGRRSSLARQVLTSALLPLILFTAVTLAFLTYLLPSAQSRLIGENARAVAVAVGGSLDTSNQDTVNAQLDALIRRTSVGFVQVELPDGTSFFRSKDAASDGTLSEQVADWVKTHPQTSDFTQSGSPADAFRSQLKDLQGVGAGQSAQAAALRQLADDPDNQRNSTARYVLARVGVAENTQGQRTVRTNIGAAPRGLLYSIVVGLPSDEALSELHTTLLLVFGVALLAFAVAALLAVRTARQVARPVERLVRAADAISMGDLTQPVRPEHNDEIGDLAQALERMRLSLDTAMERLRRRRAVK